MRRYISQKIHDEVRMNRFREALTRGGNKHPHEGVSLANFGVEGGFDEKNAANYAPMMTKLSAEHAVLEKIANGESIPDEVAEDPLKVIPPETLPERTQHPALRMKTSGAMDSGDLARVQTVISRSSTAAFYGSARETPEKSVTMDLHNAAMDRRSNFNPDMHDVNAVQMVMENILDWDFHAYHHGQTITPSILKTLAKTLKANLTAACPGQDDHEIFDLYETLLLNNWLGDFNHIKASTESVVDACLAFQNDDPDKILAVKKKFLSTIAFHERFYWEVQHHYKVPLRDIARAMDSQGEGPIATRTVPTP